ncbi:MAG: SHOCT domain-containing protein [Chloroflexota bacterium]
MSRIVMFLGILMIVVGGIGFVFGLVGAPLLIANSATQLSEPTAADLCKPGEELVTERGAESYSFSNGYSHSQTYYCVNDAGTRRDVTFDAAKNFIGGFLPSLGTLVIPIAGGGLCSIGFFLAIFGFIFSRRRTFQNASSQYVFAGQNVPSSFTATPSAPVRPPAQGDLAAKLRQIEEAHKSGLITEDEYNRMRQEILDSMQ